MGASKSSIKRKKVSSFKNKPAKRRQAMGAYTSSFKNKLDAVHDLQLALQSRRTMTAADNLVINPTLQALANQADDLAAAIAADDTPVLGGPDPADATALQNAIIAAENAIRQNATVNDLANAAAVLIGSLRQK